MKLHPSALFIEQNSPYLNNIHQIPRPIILEKRPLASLLALAARFLDREIPAVAFLSRHSYSLYVLHYPIILVLSDLLAYHATLPTILLYLIPAVLTPIFSILLGILLRRIPLLALLILGEKK